MEQQELPQFYQNPVPLNSVLHSDTTVGPGSRGLAFAANSHSVLLAGVEFTEACHEFPIIFTTVENGTAVPVALLGVAANENLFINEDGAWLGSYIPAYIRRYPFVNTDDGNQQLVVCIDESCDGYNEEGGERLFESGEPTPYLQRALALVEDYYVQMKNTEQFCSQLQLLDLLKPMDATFTLTDGRVFNLCGLLVVDEEKLQQLDNGPLCDLFRSGGLMLIYAHLLSLKNLQKLLDRKTGR
jgi:SapC